MKKEIPTSTLVVAATALIIQFNSYHPDIRCRYYNEYVGYLFDLDCACLVHRLNYPANLNNSL